MKPRTLLCPLVLLACAATVHAELAVEVDAPAVRVVVPSLPAVRMDVHPEHEKWKHLRLYGNEGPHTFTLVTPTADPGMKPQDCANFVAGDLPRRPGVPPQEGIYKTKLDSNTYMAMYVSRLAGDKLLLLTIGGDLVLAEASPEAYRELGRATIAPSTTRALPAMANGHFYCRSKDRLLCVKLAE